MKINKWYIKVTAENIDTLRKYLHSKEDYDDCFLPKIGYYVISEPKDDFSYQSWSPSAALLESMGYVPISFEYFIRNIFNREKILVGFKLKNIQYYQAASMIIYGNKSGSEVLDSIITLDTEFKLSIIKKFKELNLLDLFFEPIYEQKEEGIFVEEYEVEFLAGKIKVGCVVISNDVVKTIHLLQNKYDFCFKDYKNTISDITKKLIDN